MHESFDRSALSSGATPALLRMKTMLSLITPSVAAPSVDEVTGAIASGEVVLLQAPGAKQLEVQLEVLKRLNAADVVVIHVSTLRPYIILKSLLSKKGIVETNMRFVDAAEELSGVRSSKDIIYVQGPQDLTGILLAVQKFIDATKEKKVFFIESSSTLELHNDPVMVVRLMHALVNKFRLAGSGAGISAGIDVDDVVANNVALLCDRIVQLT